MAKQNKCLARAPSAVFLRLIALAALFPPFAGQARLIEKTALQAGDRMLSLLDVRDFRRQLKAGLVPDTMLFKVFPKKQLLSAEKPLREFLAFREALFQLAEEEEFEPSRQQITAAAAQLRGRLSPRAFDKKLRRHGLQPLARGAAKAAPAKAGQRPAPGLKPLLEEIRAALKAEFLLTREAASKVIVSDNDINSYYLKKTGRQMFRNFAYDLSSVSFAGSGEGRRLSAAFQKAALHSSFEEAAKKTGLEAKKSRLKDSEMSLAVRRALSGLSVSQSSAPLSLGGRIYIFHVKWKTPLLNPSEEREKARIQGLLFEAELKKALKKWLEQKRPGFSLKIS